MNDLPRDKLREIYQNYDARVCEDPRLCKSLLNDLITEDRYRTEKKLLVTAVAERAAAEIRDSPKHIPLEMLLSRLANRLAQDCSLTATAARWAVDSWAFALGMTLSPTATKTLESQAQMPPVYKAASVQPPATPQSPVVSPGPVLIQGTTTGPVLSRRLRLFGLVFLAGCCSFLAWWWYNSRDLDFSKVKLARTLNAGSTVRAIAFSPNGKFLAAAGDDVRLWSRDTGEMQNHFTRHTDSVTALAFSPDGKLLVTGGSDFSVYFWELPGGGLKPGVSSLKLRAAVSGLAFSPDGKLLATGSRDGEIRLWDAESAQLTLDLPIIDSSIESLAYSPNGKFLASGSGDSKVRLWNIASKEPRLLGEQDGPVGALAFSVPDGKFLASGTKEHGTNLILWDCLAAKQADSFRAPGPVQSVAFDPKSAVLLSGGSLRLWRLKTGQFENVLSGQDVVNAVTFSPSGDMFASGGGDGTVKLWQIR
jgi:uncharacterized protein with WD repeat